LYSAIYETVIGHEDDSFGKIREDGDKKNNQKIFEYKRSIVTKAICPRNNIRTNRHGKDLTYNSTDDDTVDSSCRRHEKDIIEQCSNTQSRRNNKHSLFDFSHASKDAIVEKLEERKNDEKCSVRSEYS